MHLFPELMGRWHLPRWGKVIALPELPKEGEVSDRFYPRYAADIELLDETGMPYKDKAPLQAVPLPVSGIGEQAGRLEPSAIGSIVEIGLMFGQPDKPFIRCVLPLGFTLPSIKAGESRYQQRQGVYQHIDQDGNIATKTDKDHTIQCLNERIKILESKVQEIGGNLTETINGVKTVTAKQIKLNGGKGVVTCAHICHFTGAPHGDGSTTVTAGK